MQTEDTQLLEAVGRQDQAAMATLYDRYARVVYSTALRVLREPDLAEDLTQQTFLEVWKQPGGFVSQRGSVAAWLVLAARNRAIDVLRRRAQLTPLGELVGPEPRNLREAMEHPERMRAVKDALDSVAQQDQAPLYMAYFEALGQVEIAERTGAPVETVRAQIRSTLSVVREALGSLNAG